MMVGWPGAYSPANINHIQTLYMDEGSKEDRMMSLYDQLVYGTKPLKVIWDYPQKEKVMDIGGMKCHLCGADLHYSAGSHTAQKKHSSFERHIVYQCGTQLFETYRMKPSTDGMESPKERFDRHIHAECI